jgi:hypothetical protein
MLGGPEERMFFFETKNQKTFVYYTQIADGVSSFHLSPRGVGAARFNMADPATRSRCRGIVEHS